MRGGPSSLHRSSLISNLLYHMACAAAAPEPPVPAAPPEAVCIICLDRGDEPLHRNCACRGPTAGFAHMSCLVRYVSSAAETNPDLWYDCGTCKQRYFGATMLGLARARWERAKGLPEDDEERLNAMNCLANALTDSRDYPAALPLMEERLATCLLYTSPSPRD